MCRNKGWWSRRNDVCGGFSVLGFIVVCCCHQRPHSFACLIYARLRPVVRYQSTLFICHWVLSKLWHTTHSHRYSIPWKKNPTNNESDLGLMLQLHRSNRESIDIVGWNDIATTLYSRSGKDVGIFRNRCISSISIDWKFQQSQQLRFNFAMRVVRFIFNWKT